MRRAARRGAALRLPVAASLSACSSPSLGAALMLHSLLGVFPLPAGDHRDPVPTAAFGRARHGSDAGEGRLAPAAALRLGLLEGTATLDATPHGR